MSGDAFYKAAAILGAADWSVAADWPPVVPHEDAMEAADRLMLRLAPFWMAVWEAAQWAQSSNHAPMWADGPVYRACGCAAHEALRVALVTIDRVVQELEPDDQFDRTLNDPISSGAESRPKSDAAGSSPASGHPNPRDCQERVIPDGSFQSFPCVHRAKWIATSAGGIVFTVCGVHIRRYRRPGVSITIPLLLAIVVVVAAVVLAVSVWGGTR